MSQDLSAIIVPSYFMEVMIVKETANWRDETALNRFQMISPLLDMDLDNAKRIQLRHQIAKNNNISERTLYRYEKSYREEHFEGLKPMNREGRRSADRPDNWDEIIGEAILLKREVPRRSVRQIIKILEIEGWAPPGVLKRSTLQRYLFKAGLGVKQMRRYTEATETSSRRFCRPHRMELLQADIKYGPEIRTKEGKLVKTYLSSLIDDHSRYILHSEFYDNKSAAIVEDSFHKAILQFGKFDAGYTDNGREYISTHLVKSCARLGIKLFRAKPRRGESKGKVERFHQTVDRFIAEIRIAKVHTLEEMNRRWKIFLDQDYQKDPHSGIRKYYESRDVKVPESGISPLQEWNRDSRELIFIDAGVVGEAFMHHEERIIDPAGCFSFDGHMYEASTALAGARVTISYDPLHKDVVTVNYQDMEPIHAKRVVISAYAKKTPPIPIGMTDKVPETSRFLDALEKRYNEENRMFTDAISFAGFRKEGDQ